MNKHGLMLTAAAMALLAGEALAADNSKITTKLTTQLKTSTAKNGAPSDILIDTGGSVVVTAAGPAIEIDSNNSVNNSVVGALISNLDTANAIGVRLDATAAGNGPGAGVNAFTNFGTVDLTGTGTGKTGILVGITSADATAGVTAGTFNGGIDLASGSTLKVTGDGSNGIHIASGATLMGNLALDGTIAVNASSATATTASNIAAVRLDGTLDGNLSIASTGATGAFGASAQGIVLTGVLNGSFINKGRLQAIGTLTPSVLGGNPEASSALIVNSSITGGIFNAGPISSSDTATPPAAIVTQGPAAAIGIAPLGTATSDIEIGLTSIFPSFGFVNRGTIGGQALDANFSANGINIVGAATSHVTIDGGIFNSGRISATSTNDSKALAGSSFTSTALFVGDFVNIPTLVNSNESGSGVITASLSGSNPGSAVAVDISQNDTAHPTSSLQSIVNKGSIVASAATTDATIASLSAFAIEDKSGTLLSIDNSGTIAATATALDNGKQIHVAADLSLAKDNIAFMNSGTVTGDIRLGAHNDTVTVTGDTTKLASITGDIAFGGGSDTLTINDFATVTGAITESGAGTVGVIVGTGTGSGATLKLTNTTKGLAVRNFEVKNSGTLDLSLSQAFNSTSATFTGAIIDATSDPANTIRLDAKSNFGLAFGSFISAPGGRTAQFALLEAPVGHLAIDNFATIKRQIVGDNNVPGKIPFLFTGALCGYNTAGTDACTAPAGTTAPSDSQLVVQLTPKTVDKIGLTGNATKIFDEANTALAKDDELGGKIVTDVVDQKSAQKAYASFVPDLSGSSRAVAVSITDQATGPVGARQRALRMYAAQPGGATLWGQEFVQRLNSNGDADAFRASGFGFALGVDDGDPRNGRYGAALTFFSGDQTNKGPNFTKTTNEWYMLSGYTDWRGKGFFFDSQLTAGYGRLNGKRFLQLTDPNDSSVVFTRRAKSRRNALLAAGGISSGAVLTYGSTVITPQLSVDGLTLREEGYTETGGGSTAGGDGFDLKVQPYYASSVRGYFGTTLREDLNLGDFFIQPELRGGYRYEFLRDPVKLKTAFKSLLSTPDSQFTLTGPTQRRGTVVGGASLAITTGAWSLGVNYDYLRGSGGSVSQVGTVTLVGRI